jgi:restriction system protein
MAAKGAICGFVVTSGRFTEDVKAFADGRNVQLVDGPKLFAMIKQAKQSIATRSPKLAAPPIASASRSEIGPACPQCGSSMVKRTARKGSNAGAEFWGCSKFPAC